MITEEQPTSVNDVALVIYVIIEHVMAQTSMRGSRRFCHKGSNLDNVFFVVFFSLMRRGRIQIPLLVGHQWPASETPFKWRFAGGPMMAQTLNAG